MNEKISPAEAAALYRAYRRENRPFRRAFGRGEKWRKILLAVGEVNAKAKERS